jgi:hypothetical protein
VLAEIEIELMASSLLPSGFIKQTDSQIKYVDDGLGDPQGQDDPAGFNKILPNCRRGVCPNRIPLFSSS